MAVIRYSPRSLVALVAAMAMAVALHAQQGPAFRSQIDLVLLNVTVIGPGGRLAADLSPDDFQILEQGRPQELAFFSPASVPLSVSLVLDTSASMDEQMPQAKQAAMDFIAKLRPGDVAEVVTFDSRVEVLQPLTGDRLVGDGDSAYASQRLNGNLQRGLYRPAPACQSETTGRR